MSPLTLQQELDWLYSTQLFGMKLGLTGITHLLRSLELDQPSAGTRIIHVAGTNGKGSTCATMERLARAAGYRTGLFTSPHLIRFHERLRVGGQMIDDASLTRLLCQLRVHVTEGSGTVPTFFELVFALALLYYREQDCDLLILETGMGGRLDATNALPKDVAVITPIALDHTQYLGDTLAAVAGEKAGIIHQGNLVLSAPQEESAAAVIKERAATIGAQLCEVIPPLPDHWQLSLIGAHQRENAALALAALRALPDGLARLSDEVAETALRDVQWSGRFEHIRLDAQRVLILDGAHNPHAMHALVQSWREQYGDRRVSCLFACSADKELPAVITLLGDIVAHWHLVPVNSPRTMDTAELAPLIAQHHPSGITCHDSLEAGLAALQGQEVALACGSFFLLGELLALLKGASYRSTAQ